MTQEITNSQDYLDSRNIEERIIALKKEIKDEEEEKLREELQEELNTLEKLKKQYIEDYSKDSWEFGAQFINDYCFEDYAQQFCEDVGYVTDNLPWFVENAIDWSEVAEAMQMDYTEIDFNGQIYWTQEA